MVREDTDTREARLEAMLDEFRAAQQRRLVEREIKLWNRTCAAHRATVVAAPPPPEKLD
jgi:hypothetical protein